MSNLKSLKEKIVSVNSMKKITSAMEAVSIVKLKKTKKLLFDIRDYCDEIRKSISLISKYISLSDNSRYDDHDADVIHSINTLIKESAFQKPYLIIVSPDRGLCGNLNTAIFKAATKKIEGFISENKKPLIFPIGKRAIQFVKKYYPTYLDNANFAINQSCEISDIDQLSERIIQLHLSGNIDHSCAIYINFVSPIKQDLHETHITPYNYNNIVSENDEKNDLEFDFEPNPIEIIDGLIKKDLSMYVYRCILETTTSEHAARIVAMKNSTENAGKAIKNLLIVYNRTRQMKITNDMIDIVSGKEAV